MYIQSISLVIIIITLSGFGCSNNPKDTIGPSPETYEFDVAWSPDGEIIAACWHGLPSIRDRGIYFINTSDWSVEPFLVEEGIGSLYYSPSWSPDGKWLAFAKDAQIYKIKRNGDSLTQLTFTNRQWDCSWSYSDTLISYRISFGDSSGIWIMNTNGEDKTHLTRYTTEGIFTRGDSFLYIESVESNIDTSHMVLFCFKDSTNREIMRWKKGSPYHFYSYPKITLNHQKIVLVIESYIWSVDLNGQNLTQLTTYKSGHPNWSPDGCKIVYVRANLEGGEIWIMDSDGSNQIRIPSF